ncbi:hypothetical protein OPKNFCMD_3958 [Methylobacterium crusticola]|uniref:Phasin family protein n=1 Tax=Methylobacterium crusticola TaxID=1697972 RepID=A0ABQ4R1N3_9HYPH|nr:hypothetical protein [Methylobacterium crusticola]GJD51206.1 hypothetical protein OPKNFCMD_3958 [Methylobacterium crusticola]
MSDRADQSHRDGVEAGRILAEKVVAAVGEHTASPDLMQRMETEWQRLMAATSQERAASGVDAAEIEHWHRGIMSGAGSRFRELAAQIGPANDG